MRIAALMVLAACKVVDDNGSGDSDPNDPDPVNVPDATGSWSGSCYYIGGLDMELTDEDGTITGTIIEATSSSGDMVVDGTRTDADLTLSVTYADSEELLGTLELTLDGDSLDGEYLYPGEDSGDTCAFIR